MNLALFDFDETLIRQNSLSYLFKEVTNKRFIFTDALSLAFKLNTYRHGIRYSIKRRLYKKFLAGVSEEQLYEAGRLSSRKLKPIENVVDCLYRLHEEKYIIWVVTATPTLFIKGVIDQWNWPVDKVIGTELYQDNSIYTGEFGEECMRDVKVKRIGEMIDNEKLEPIIEFAYGNLPVDIPMMKLANKSYAVDGERIEVFN